MLKKFAGIFFMVLALVLPSVSPAGAVDSAVPQPSARKQNVSPANNISPEEALEILRKTFPKLTQGKDFELQTADYLDDDLYRFFWRNWEYRPLDNTSSRISASIDPQSGELVQFIYRPDPALYQGQIAVLSREEALEVAENFLQQLPANKLSELVYVDNSGSYYPLYDLQSRHYFSWKRIVNDIYLDWDGVNIEVDPVIGVITEYHSNWTNNQLPPAKNIISPEKINHDLLEEIGVYPAYQSAPGVYTDDSLTPLIPVYFLNTNIRLFDAQSGEALNYDGRSIQADDIRIYSKTFKPELDVDMVESPATSKKKLSPQTALQTAQKFSRFLGMRGEIRQTGSDIPGTDPYSETWSYSLSKDNKEPSLRIRLNAYTGEIVSFHDYRSSSEGTTPGKEIPYKQAVNNAREMMSKVHPEKSNQVVLRNEFDQDLWQYRYFLRFDRLINGIPYKHNGIDIEVDRKTGNVVNYRLEWQDLKVSPLSNLIQPEKALEILITEKPFELAYVLPPEEDYEKNAEALLVYRISNPPRVDAVSGRVIGQIDNRINPAELSAFKDHWATPALSLLYQSGLLPEEGIKADEAVNRRQAIRVLTAAINKNHYYNDDKVVELNFTDIEENDPDNGTLLLAVKSGILSNEGEFEPDGLLSRESLAVWLCNSLGYQEIARMKHKIETPFKDSGSISEDKKNYVSMAHGLGLLTADQYGYFRPQDPVSWAELATVVLRLAPNLQ